MAHAVMWIAIHIKEGSKLVKKTIVKVTDKNETVGETIGRPQKT